jgi:hypothetical protein
MKQKQNPGGSPDRIVQRPKRKLKASQVLQCRLESGLDWTGTDRIGRDRTTCQLGV